MGKYGFAALAACQLLCGIFLILQSESNEKEFRAKMSDHFLPYSDEDKADWKRIQSSAQCCGIDGPDDWLKYSYGIPAECCDDGKGIRSKCKLANAFVQGCAERYAFIMAAWDWTLGAIGIGSGVVFASFSYYHCILV